MHVEDADPYPVDDDKGAQIRLLPLSERGYNNEYWHVWPTSSDERGSNQWTVNVNPI